MPDARPNQSSKSLDAVVVGGGVIGLASAWRAAQQGMRVRVIERDEPGSGASGVAAGMLAPVGEATWGEEDLLLAALVSHEMWPEFAAELAEAAGDDETSLMQEGGLHVALDADEAAELRRRFDLMRSLGLDADWLSGTECRELEPGLGSSAYAGAFAPHEAGVDPLAVVSALHRACLAAGVDVVTGRTVARAIWEGDSIRGVTTYDGNAHHARETVLAAGAWSGTMDWLPEAALPPVRPVKGQIVTLRGEDFEQVAGRIVVTERVYLVPRLDGRLVAGATVEEMGFDTRITAGGIHELLREAYRALPQVAELEMERAVAGLRPGTPDNAPIIGRGTVEGLILATGHYRNGVLLAPLTARGVVDLLNGGELPVELEMADPARFVKGSDPLTVVSEGARKGTGPFVTEVKR